MQHVRFRVAALGFGQGAARPVVALPRGRQLDAEIGPEQHVQAEGPGAEKSGGDRGVEQGGEAEPPALELDQVVVARVQDGDDRRCGEHRRERPEVAEGDRVDEPDVARWPGQLDQREALGIVMQAVALGIESDFAGGDETPRDVSEVGSRLDPVGRAGSDGPGPAQAFVSRMDCSSRSCRRRSASRPSSWVIT